MNKLVIKTIFRKYTKKYQGISTHEQAHHYNIFENYYETKNFKTAYS